MGTAPFLTAALKYMYRYLIMSQNLEAGVKATYDSQLQDYFVEHHLQPVVALAIATKRRLQTRRSWRLDPSVPYNTIRTSLHTVVDGSWGCLSGSASLTYLIQRYTFQGQPRVSIYLYSSATAMNSLTKLGHQVDRNSELFNAPSPT